jgi:hypothetical protein
MTSLFPPRESFVVTSRLGTGNSRTFFYGVRQISEAVSPPPSPPILPVNQSSQTMLLAVSLEAPSLIVSGTARVCQTQTFLPVQYSLFPGFFLSSRMNKNFLKTITVQNCFGNGKFHTFCFLGHSPIYCVKFFFSLGVSKKAFTYNTPFGYILTRIPSGESIWGSRSKKDRLLKNQ